MDNLLILVLIVIISVCILFSKRLWGASNVVKGKPLPGPRQLPFIGNSLQVDFQHLHISVSEMVKQFGTIFQIKLLGQTAVVISDPVLLRRAFGSEEYGDVFNDRPDSFYGKYLGFDCSGIGFAKANKATMIKRRMFHRAFKFYGDGIDHFERIAEDEIKRFLEDLERTNQCDFDMNEILRKSFANTTVSLMTGKSAEAYDSQIIWDFIECGNLVSDPGMNFIYGLMPIVRFFPGRFGNMYRKAIEARDIFLNRFYFRLKESLAKSDEEQYGLVNTLIKLQKEENKLVNEELIDEKHMKAVVVDVTFVTTETTTVALTNAFALLLVHSHVAKKIQSEVDSAVGSARLPRISDKQHMPFTMATVYETLRYTTAIAPLCLPHRVMRDQVLEGYHMPKNSLILSNIWFIHHNPDVWEEPWLFQPERFLDSDGNLLPSEHRNRRNFLAFSTGHRDCPGENLGKSRLFLYIATVLQSFDILPRSSGELPDTDPRSYIPGTNLIVRKHLCRVVSRM